MSKAAILVDGGFYHKRRKALWGEQSASDAASTLVGYCMRHLNAYSKSADRSANNSSIKDEYKHRELYRIFYYDSPPSSKKVFHPYLNRTVDLKKTDVYEWNTSFLDELKKKRKVALRLGYLSEEQAHYTIRPSIVKQLFNGKKQFSDLAEDDFYLSIDQKGVDIKIGTDITSLAYKKQVDKIILIAGDSDFVPAAKLARREGIDFVLDPLHATIKPDLFEHIDGLRTCIGYPKNLSYLKNQ